MTQTPVVTYPTYLQLDKILDAQTPLGPVSLGSTVRAAEQFFIVVHQAFELWFKQVLTDLECSREALGAQPREPERALDHLLRVASIFRLLHQQMVLFDHLSPHSFLAFRPYLGTASGSESEQWRQVQKALGLRGQARSPLSDLLESAARDGGLTLLDVYREPYRAGVLYRAGRRVGRHFRPVLATLGGARADRGADNRAARRHRRHQRCAVPA